MPRKADESNDTSPAFAPLTEQDVEAWTDSGSYRRGQSCFRNGHIHDTVPRGETIEAQCEGSDALNLR
jgi:uncharacterized Zn finger protein